MESLLFFLLCLIPIIFYCLIFAWINSRERGLLVNGAWDFVGILFAASGFLILAGPSILAGIFDRLQLAQVRGGAAVNDGTSFYLWKALSFAYFGIVVGGAIAVIRRRRALTTAYNVDPEALTRELTFILDHLGLPWVRSENSYFIRHGLSRTEGKNGVGLIEPVASKSLSIAKDEISEQSGPPITSTSSQGAGSPVKLNPDQANGEFESNSIVLSLEASPALRNVTLNWKPAESNLRQQVESELNKHRSRFKPRNNPTGFWLLCAASFLILTVFAGGAVIVVASLAR
jgi:hypothetical protein